uniref:Holocarboxylase synthetase n=1 Tax=Cynoglossus semilaevis TaxID=244447 RepID=A0A3P8VAW9_CYNSE
MIVLLCPRGSDRYCGVVQVLKWSDCCLPLAWCPGHPFRAVAQATVDDFSRLGVAFIEDRLQMDDGLVPSKIIPVVLPTTALTELLEKQCSLSSKSSPCQRSSLLLLTPRTRKRVEERRGSEPLRLGPGADPDDRSSGSHHMEAHGHHLHLSSCHECLELESSTILSVKYASADNIPDLPDDSSAELDTRADKPPNVLVFTDGNQERFAAVQQLLSECLDMDTNIVYPLQPQQVLSDPWLDNTKLLVVAEESTLTPQCQTCFLTYLSQGGRVLGLSSSLCPAGLGLEVRPGAGGQVRKLNFFKEDDTELQLSVLSSGRVFVRDPRGGGEVELWGELKGDAPHQRDMVVVKVTHGEDGGEAVLCQVHLETSPDSLTTDGFDELKLSNSLRYEVLTEILTSLGLSCDQNQTTAPSPVHLLATSELRDGAPPADDSLPLLTDSSDSSCQWENFSMETYRKNLKTSVLGNTLLYAETVTSTMDLLDGMSLNLPPELGLVAVAGRQSQGRGRGKNAWLSPAGCAMFTLKVQVELGSRLGQRISFLQHLAALAVVESVRTLPGYQDLDLRVKWPNDIYYGHLMKLGHLPLHGIAVSSARCGFNVTNSNPTICINDLVRQFNVQNRSSLQPLSCPQLIARTLTCLDSLVSSFQRGGADAVLPTYYKRWLHGEDGLEAEVVGLDQNGFLQVHTTEHGLVSVEPDGNSFDMMKNLVLVKKH